MSSLLSPTKGKGVKSGTRWRQVAYLLGLEGKIISILKSKFEDFLAANKLLKKWVSQSKPSLRIYEFKFALSQTKLSFRDITSPLEFENDHILSEVSLLIINNYRTFVIYLGISFECISWTLCDIASYPFDMRTYSVTLYAQQTMNSAHNIIFHGFST